MPKSVSRPKPTITVRTHARAPDVRATLDAFRHIVQALRIAPGGRNISGAQLFALQQIAEHPDASVNEIAALTFTHQSSVSVVIQRLVDAGLVARIPSKQDRRQRRLAVTAKGSRAIERVPTTVQQRLVAAVSGLPPADRRSLARSLSVIARSVTPAGKMPPPPMFFEDEGGKGRSGG